jgi:Flp pilus assembly protein TadG
MSGRWGDDGNAVVEFALVSVMVLMLLLAVVQVAVYLHIRAVATASAAEGARYAANADVPTEAGGPRAADVLRRGVGAATAARLRCTAAPETAAPEVDPDGGALVGVRCAGTLPVFFAPLGGVLPVDVTGRALEEGP